MSGQILAEFGGPAFGQHRWHLTPFRVLSVPWERAGRRALYYPINGSALDFSCA